MPIASADNTAGNNPLKSTVEETVASTVVVNVDDILLSMRQYVNGAHWTVDYYHLTVGEDQDITQLDPNLPIPEQQYEKIVNMELMVTSPLETNVAGELEGEATVGYGVIPTQGDLFIATTMNGVHGLFRVTEVIEGSYTFDRIFTIRYKLYTTEDADKALFDTLVDRTVREFIFSRESLTTGGDPVLLKEDYAWQQKLLDFIDRFPDLYYDKFFSNNLRILCVGKHYDPYIEFFFRYTAMDRCRNTIYLSSNGLVDEKEIRDTLYEILLTKGNPTYVTRRLAIQGSVGSYRGHQSHYRIRGTRSLAALETIVKLSAEGTPFDPIEASDDAFPKGVYLVSDDWYGANNTDPLTPFEVMLKAYINRDTILREMLEPLLDRYRGLSDKEQYHYGPILFILARDAVDTQYSIT